MSRTIGKLARKLQKLQPLLLFLPLKLKLLKYIKNIIVPRLQQQRLIKYVWNFFNKYIEMLHMLTKNALLQHINRASYKAGLVWGQSSVPKQVLPDALKWGWITEGSKLVPY